MKPRGRLKSSTLLIGSACVMALVTAAGEASAAPLKVTKSAAGASLIDTRVTTSALGMVKVLKGSVKFSGNDVTIASVPDWLFDRHTVLTGKVVDNRIGTVNGKTGVSGMIYFLDGDWINSLSNVKRTDNLELTDGTVLAGRVRAVNADTIDFQVSTGQTRRVKVSEIKSLVSPRAFAFNIAVSNMKVDSTTGNVEGEAETISFNPSYSKQSKTLFAWKGKQPQEPRSVLAGSEGGVTKAQMAGMLLLDVTNTIAPAIVAPIVAPLGYQQADFRLQQNAAQEMQQQALQAIPQGAGP